jgi:hypothetical protein
LFCQETSQLTSTRLLSFVTGQGESKSCSRENVLLWKIIFQNILVHTRIIKIQMLNCYCQLSSSVIFRQYCVSQSEWKIDRPRPGLPRVSPRPHTEALGTRLLPLLSQSRSPSMPVRRLRVSIALEKSNWFTLNFQREFYACSAMLQNINKVFRISHRKFDTFYTEIELKTTKNSGGKYVRKLWLDRDTATWKIQGELRRFEWRRFDLYC